MNPIKLSSENDYKWFVRGYYNDTVKPPKKPGALAIEVGSPLREGLDMDIVALETRKDIGVIEVSGTSINDLRGEEKKAAMQL